MARVALTGILLGGGAVRRETSGKAGLNFLNKRVWKSKGVSFTANSSVGKVAWVRSRVGYGFLMPSPHV